jgi:hypothetical protein
VGTARCVTGSTTVVSTSPVCGTLLPHNAYPRQQTAASCWRWTWHGGYARMRTPARSGRSATPTARGKDQHLTAPGWRYSIVAALETGELEIMVVLDAGYDAPRIAHLLGELPVEILGRMRSGRVLRQSVPPRAPGTNGRPPKHGGEFVFGDPATWGAGHVVTTTTNTRLYGTATAQA